jgi:CheY-like chemotaxis protein
LLDLQMPVMTGWDVLSELRQAGTRIPVVFMSAGYRVRAEAERHGADGHLAKPFDLVSLLDTVQRFTRA